MQNKLLGVELWQWLALLCVFVLSWLAGWLFGTLVIGFARRVTARTKTPTDDEIVLAARGPTRLIFGVIPGLLT